MTLRQALQTTTAFLSASIATETGVSSVQRLYNAIPSSWTPPRVNLSPLAIVILYSLDLLGTVNTASATEKTQLGIKDRRQVNALIELILVLGLYKALTAGVGVPETRRIQSVLLRQESRNIELPEKERPVLLQEITLSLKALVEEGGEVGELLQRQHAVDILSGLNELSFNPSNPESERLSWTTQYETFLSRYRNCNSILMLDLLYQPCWLISQLCYIRRPRNGYEPN